MGAGGSVPVPQLTAKFTKGVDYARVLHAADVRKGTTIPYLSHVLAVASIVLEHGGTEDQAIAALLHDAGEDHGGELRIAAIRAEFGDVVADIVEACSDDLPTDRNAKRDWWFRKTDYIDRLGTEPLAAVLVSAADKLHNARALVSDHRVLGPRLWERFNRDAGRGGTLWYYTTLCDVIEVRLRETAPALAQELRATVDAMISAVSDNEPGVTLSELKNELEEMHEKANAIGVETEPVVAEDTGELAAVDVIRFYEKDDPYFEFTNFAHYPVTIDGVEWPTSEHYYQAQKFSDPLRREQIRAASGPGAAQKLGQSPRGRRPDWNQLRLEVMREALIAKFTQHVELRTLLLDTGDAHLIEASTKDRFFGEGKDGTGKNHLGLLLEEVRDLLRGDVRMPEGDIVVAVEGVQYVVGQERGDLGAMLDLPEYNDALFVFNDNERQFREHLQHGPGANLCVAGSGNAKIRHLQCQANPRVMGVPTGDSGGYAALTPHVREVVHEATGQIRQLLATGRFRRVFFNAAPDGLIATGIFKVDDEVRQYITDELRALATN
ncbi:MAG: NADAR domain-containing protein [Acidimicrobiales bacterium]